MRLWTTFFWSDWDKIKVIAKTNDPLVIRKIKQFSTQISRNVALSHSNKCSIPVYILIPICPYINVHYITINAQYISLIVKKRVRISKSYFRIHSSSEEKATVAIFEIFSQKCCIQPSKIWFCNYSKLLIMKKELSAYIKAYQAFIWKHIRY